MEKEPRKSAFSSSRKFYSSPFTRLPRSWFALSEESVREFFFHELVKFGFVPYFRSFVPRPNERNLFEWRRRWRLRNDNNSRKKKEIRIIEYSRRETNIERRFPPKKAERSRIQFDSSELAGNRSGGIDTRSMPDIRFFRSRAVRGPSKWNKSSNNPWQRRSKISSIQTTLRCSYSLLG